MNLNGSKMFTLHAFSWVTSAFLFCGSGKILASGKAENASSYPGGSSSFSTTPHQAKRFPQTPAQVLDLIHISPIYPLTAASSFRIRTSFHVEKSLGSSAKTHKSQTSLLCDARSHKSHIKSLNVNEFFCATSSHQTRNASNSKNSQNKKSLNVTDSEPKPLFYSSTKGSSFYSVLSPVAVCKRLPSPFDCPSRSSRFSW
jgi:hypothetical protein